MQPGLIQAGGWDQLSRLMVYLYLFTGLGLASAMAFLLAQAIVPSLVGTRDLPRPYLALRWPLLVLTLVAAGLAVYALWSALGLSSAFLNQYYPRALE